ncbi:MAG: RluA family pseudouridine synthase [Acutalibacteraceae bacterium]|nr:RluA family pseudouridine synthase [Acutalibacteraceae bacterium]
MEILYEDSSVIVVIKPQGMLSQADKNGGESMITKLQNHTGGEIYPVHRLDKETGGVMVYAKTKEAAAKLCRDISEYRFYKEYLALVHGVPEKESDTLCDLLFHDRTKNKSYLVKRARGGVKKAELEYRLLETKEIDGETYSLLSIVLHTGRTHQIRVQFGGRKMPLSGDRKYGAQDNCKALGLWAVKLKFTHPETGQVLEFKAEKEFEQIKQTVKNIRYTTLEL